MRVAVFSDIHADINTAREDPDFTLKLIAHLNEMDIDMLLVVGDISGSFSGIQSFFYDLQTVDVKYRLFCPGNHDIWVNQASFDGSLAKYYELLPELSQYFDWHYLPQNPLIIDGIGFAGTIGWYDYSTRNLQFDDQINKESYQQKINPVSGSKWMDRYFAKFGNLTDGQITSRFNLDLQMDLKKLGIQSNAPVIDEKNVSKNNPKTEYLSDKNKKDLDTLIVSSHFVPFQEFITYRGTLHWDYFSAFIGNLSLGQIINDIPSGLRRIACFGHTHSNKQMILSSGVEGYCSPIGYNHEWNSTSLEEVFSKRISLLDI
jgi:hypothetical protein